MLAVPEGALLIAVHDLGSIDIFFISEINVLWPDRKLIPAR